MRISSRHAEDYAISILELIIQLRTGLPEERMFYIEFCLFLLDAYRHTIFLPESIT